MTDTVEGAPPIAAPSSQTPNETQTENPTDLQSDDQLIAAYLTGDQAAFEVLYARYKNSVYGYFKRQLIHAQAQDAFQDTWIKVIDQLPRYHASSKFSGYLFTIAHNVLMDVFRKQARTPEGADIEEEALTSDEKPTDGGIDQADLHNQLQTELRKLPVQQRSVWILKQETDLSIEQIAKMTSSTKEGVKSRLRYANEKLKAGMQKYVRARS